MHRTFQISIVLLVSAIVASACSFTVGPAPTAAPTIIFVPVTVTPGATATPEPTNTPEPPPTMAEPPTATIVPATPTSELLHFYVSGYVWHDTCAPYDPVPTPIPAGCLFDPIDGLSADGIFQTGEPGIGNVIVRLEIDCNYGAFTVATNASGYYSMSFTVPKSAGVSEQKICLSVNATSPENASILIPGGWTWPKTNSATAVIQITIPVEQQNTVNFGWDYQFQ